MVGDVARGVWAEPRPAQPTERVWRDWALVGVLVAGSVLELGLREDLGWAPLVLAVSIVIAVSLLWRRTHPLTAVAVAFGTVIAFDLARLLVVDATGLLSIAGLLVLPYALLRWGSGREAVTGLGVILVWLAVTHLADATEPAEVVAGYGFFLLSAALGASIRFHANARVRDIEQAKLRQRNELARELHDAVGHHVSAIAIQAQAGRSVAATHPERAAAALATIEEAASRTLTEMRAMVGVLRDGAEPDFAPQPGVADIERLARTDGQAPRVDVHLAGDFTELAPAVGASLYRIAQESVTNALRHARGATEIAVRAEVDGEDVRLSVRDDGGAAHPAPAGYGLAGMAERASLLGGTLRAGPGPDRGWAVDAVLPKQGVRS